MAEDEIIKKHTKAVYKAYKDPEKDWKHKLKDILLEIAIIVFAVSISIWFHNWSEDMKDRGAEKEFLMGLKTDLAADIKEMDGDRASLKKEMVAVSYFQRVGGGEAVNEDSLKKNFWIFFAATQINPRVARYETLKGSGKLDIISNKKLLYDITDLYQKDFPQIFRMNQTVNSLVSDKIDVFIEDNVNLAASGNILNAQDLLRKSKMRILLLQCGGMANSVNAYNIAISKSNDIIKEIKKELE